MGSLRAPAFRWWFIGQVLSVSGTFTQAVAISWLVLQLTGSGLALGLLGSSSMLPLLLGGPLAGALADRVDRRRLLVVTQSTFILLAGTLAVLLMMAAFGLGGIGGALLAAGGRAMPSGRSVRLLALLTGLSVLATAAAPVVGVTFAGLAVTGCLSIWFIARANTLVQLRADPSMRGRVMGIWVMALPGTSPVTSPAIGFTAGSLGPREGFGLAGAALLLTAAAGWGALADRGEAVWSAPTPGGDGVPAESWIDTRREPAVAER